MTTVMADNNRVVWQYTDDSGADWAVSAKEVYVLDATDGAKYGGESPAGTVPQKPRQLRMRAVKLISSGHVAIWVTVYDVSCALWATPGTEVVRDLNGVDVTYTSTKGRRGEKNPNGIRQTA